MAIIGEKPWVKVVEENQYYGKFVVEPLEKGYGVTLGNSLRRVLLSSLPGSAITSIKIDGVVHEFSTVPGMVEDMMNVILNLKEVVVKSHADSPKSITLKAKGKKEVKASDIEHDAEVEIINPDKHIATLESAGKLAIEMVVERGRGFSSAADNKKTGQAIGVLPIDSIFTPIRKVNLTTEEVRVGREINYDKLVLEVWTTGAIKPSEAVMESARILARHVDLFINLGKPVESLGLASPQPASTEDAALDMTIEDFEFSARSYNCLRSGGIKTIRDLVQYSEADLMKIKNFGAKSGKEIKEKLTEHNLSLRGEEINQGEEV
ncbi:MAG: DNA-directed RNA polymerase subunit alpha [bacterium]